MRDNIAKIEYVTEKDIIKCGNLFTVNHYTNNIDWKYLASRCGILVTKRAYVKEKSGDEVIWRRRGKFCGTREQHLELSEKLGMPAKRYAKILKGVQYSAWIKGKEDLIRQLGFGFRGKRSQQKITLINKHLEVLRQYQKDSLHHLLPLALYFNKTPKEFKQLLGKGLWKQYCKNSFSRNKLISENIYNLYPGSAIGIILSTYGKSGNFEKSLRDSLAKAVTIPSSIYRYNHVEYSDSFLYSANILKQNKTMCKKDAVREYIYLFQDTKRMAIRLQEDFNPSWSLRTMQEKHEQFTRQIEGERYPDTFIKCLKEINPKEYPNDTYTAILLTTPMQIKLQGNSQRHCVASYVDYVIQGEYLVYNVVNNNTQETVSTIGIRRDVSINRGELGTTIQWKLSQHHGPCNSQVSEILKEFAWDLILELNNQVGDSKNENKK